MDVESSSVVVFDSNGRVRIVCSVAGEVVPSASRGRGPAEERAARRPAAGRPSLPRTTRARLLTVKNKFVKERGRGAEGQARALPTFPGQSLP